MGSEVSSMNKHRWYAIAVMAVSFAVAGVCIRQGIAAAKEAGL